MRHSMIVIGVDGAEWTVIDELWRQGRLPTLRALAERGSRAKLGTGRAESPVIWSTIATGVLPSVHGINGVVEATPPQGDIPVSSALRRVPAIWNMLTSLGRRTMVVGWWASWPAEPIEGVVITDRILERIDGSFSPPSFAPEVERGLAESQSEESRARGLEVGESRDRAMAWFARRLAREDFDLLLVSFRSTDLASHFDWRFFGAADPPPGSDAGEAYRQRERLFGAYETVDRSIAEIVAGARRPVNVIVLSDHGFRTAREELVRVTLDFDAVLERLGYLVREGGAVDVERSRVYTHDSGHNQANKMLRFGGAAPSSAQARGALRAALDRDLARLAWSGGAPAVSLGDPPPRLARRGGDLMAQVRTESAAAPLLLDGRPLDGVPADVRRISGGHGPSTAGILIAAGPDIAKDAALDGIHVRDMTPTFLYGLDAPVAHDFAGRPWRELYTARYRAAHPAKTIATWGTREHGAAPQSAADEKLIEELRGLGYLD